MQIDHSPQAQFKKTEATKFFHLLQQKIPDVTHTLRPKDLMELVKEWGNGDSFSTTILDSLNPSGKDLTERHFQNCVSAFFSQQISSCNDMVLFNRNIKDLLLKQYEKKNPTYDMLKSEFPPPTVFEDQATLIRYQQQVVSFHGDLRYSLGTEFDHESIKKLNYILSSIYHSYQYFSKIAFEEVVAYIKSGFLETVLTNIEHVSTQEDYYKCLLLLAEASKFEAIQTELLKTSFYQQSHWQSHLSNYYKYSNSPLDLLSFKTAIEAFLLRYIQIQPQFVDWMILWLASNPEQATKIFIPSYLNTQVPLYVKYNVHIFNQLLQRSHYNKNRSNICLIDANVRDIQNFAMKVLTTGTVFTVEPSIRLLSETVKSSLGDYYNQRNVGLILKALEAKPPQLNLIHVVLQTFQNSLKYQNSDIYWIFVRSKICLQFIQEQLALPFEGDGSFHVQCLEIIYLMARPELITFFQEHHLFDVLLLVCKQHQLLITFVTKILLKAIKSVISKKISNTLNLQTIIQILILSFESAGRKEDLVMNAFLDSQFPYINKQIYTNGMKSLHLMQKNTQKNLKKLSLQDKEGIYSLSILNQMATFSSTIKDNEFSKKMIKEDIEFQIKNQEVRMFRLIWLVGEELVRVHKDKEVALRRMLFNARNKILAGFYAALSLHELEAENVPILIEYQVRYPSEFQSTFSRLLPSALTYQTFKVYLLEIINDKLSKQEKGPLDNVCFIDQLHAQNIVSNENQFKVLIKNCLKSSSNQYRVKLKVVVDQLNASSRSSYHGSMRYMTTRQNLASTRLSPHTFRTEYSLDYVRNLARSRSPISRSPIRQTGNPFVRDSSPRQLHMCEHCHSIPCPNDRFCKNCNKL